MAPRRSESTENEASLGRVTAPPSARNLRDRMERHDTVPRDRAIVSPKDAAVDWARPADVADV
jgi:hypothetical protein